MLWLHSVSCHHGDHGEPGSWIYSNKLVCTLISQSSEPITYYPKNKTYRLLASAMLV